MTPYSSERITRAGTRLITALALVLAIAGPLPADDLTTDATAPQMQSVSDVLSGRRTLLRQDDLTLTLSYKLHSGGANTDLIAFRTENSNFQPNPQGVNLATSADFPAGVQASSAIGRMYNNGYDVLIAMTQASDNPLPGWTARFWDPVQGTNLPIPLGFPSAFAPYGQIYSQIVMGDYTGDGLTDALLFYCSVDPGQKIEWAMTVLTAQDPAKVGSIKQGPQFYTLAPAGVTVPITGSIVAGDFNGDGIDEIAALFTDSQTVQFYAIDRQTLKISETTSLKLPHPISPGTLAAGRFRNILNDEVVAVGQISGAEPGNTIYSIQTMQMKDGTSQFLPAVAQSFTQIGWGRGTQVGGILTQVAPIVNWAQGYSEQLVIGLQYNSTPTGIVWITSFDDDFNFKLAGWTDVEGESGCLLGMQVGNFNNMANGQHNPNLQIALFELEGDPDHCHTPFNDGDLKLKIVNINVPAGLQPSSPPPPSNWLHDAAVTDLKLPAGYSDMRILALTAGDLQGRSLQLGTPEKVVIPRQIQPDIVLGIPPMHIDFIKPNTNTLNPSRHPGCGSPTTPCLLNLTVLPSLPAPGIGFATAFDFSSETSSSAERKSTVSWGVGMKTTMEGDVSFGDELEGSELDIKNTMSDNFNQSFTNQYNTYSGKKESLQATTGFADHVLFTQREMNVYYYPVLGRTGCPASNPNCPDSQKVPTYIAFSVPDQVSHGDLDATTLEWYQPVHEPGNILSYPWTRYQLQQGFSDTLKILSQDPPPWRGTDTSATSYSATWTGTQKNSNSMGITNAFSDDLSVSYSTHAGIKDVASASFSTSIDITASTSLNTLNTSTASLSESTGITVNKPAFDSDIAQCCLYNFAGYIFGAQSPNAPFQQINVSDPSGNPVDIQQAGPLYVGFMADPTPDSAGLTPAWWRQVYNTADVGLNHPGRWGWDKSSQVATFNPADRSGNLSPLDQPFYQMKGFFVNKTGDSTLGPNLAQATAGDKLTLTARVYNFSLVDTPQTIHVRFYGQYYCGSGATTEASCAGGSASSSTTACTAGNLCGNSFLIGETQIGSIAGFKSQTTTGDLPNWVMASVPFDTTSHGNAFMVFWVVTWMQNANGQLMKEMASHGLTSLPTANVRQITDIAVEPYSNNVGMYGVNSPFFIFPPGAAFQSAEVSARVQPAAVANAATPTVAAISRISLDGQGQMLIGQKDKVVARFETADGAVGPLTVAYYDGKPGAGGKLLDIQSIPHIAENSAYHHRIFFTPDSCGDHSIFAQTSGPGVLPTLSEGHVKNVRIDPVAAVTGLKDITARANLAENIREYLQLALKVADRSFRDQKQSSGEAAIDLYIEMIESDLPNITREVANRMVAPAKTLLGCVRPAGSSQEATTRGAARAKVRRLMQSELNGSSRR